mmetsp:Transcript_16356/g.46747  ORF Transcript_16356/g.46747 Transcript_16356/m.46747 type:complete len:286 (+) Transcript_16356:179-1036(+)
MAHIGPAVIMVVGSDAAFEVWQRQLSGTELGSRVAIVQRPIAGQADLSGEAVPEAKARVNLPSSFACDAESVCAAPRGDPRRPDFVLWNATKPACGSPQCEEEVEADLAFQHEGLGRATAVYFLLYVTPGVVGADMLHSDIEHIRSADRVILSAPDTLSDRARAWMVAKIQAVSEGVPACWDGDEDLEDLLSLPCPSEDYSSEEDGLSTMSTDDESEADDAIDWWGASTALEYDQGYFSSENYTKVALQLTPGCTPNDPGQATALRPALLDEAIGRRRRRRTWSA